MKRIWLLALIVACDGGSSPSGQTGGGSDVDGQVSDGSAGVTSDVQTGADTAVGRGADAAADASTPASDVAPDAVACRPPTLWTDQPAFEDATAEVGLVGVTGIRLSAADLDGDGYPDLVVRNVGLSTHDPGAPRLAWVLMNRPGEGGRRFVDATEESGFLALPQGGTGRTSQIVVFGDVDNDGDLDAFSGVSVNPDPSTPDNGDRNEILLNAGDGTFALAPGGDLRHPDKRYAAGGASFLDADRDGLLDLFVGYGNGVTQPDLDRLYVGDGVGSFKDITKLAGLVTPGWSSVAVLDTGKATRNTWGTTVCDVDDDGWPDLLTASYGRLWNGLWMGGFAGGVAAYTDRSVESGYGMDQRVDWRTNFNAQCYCQLVPDAEDCAGVAAPPAYFPCTTTGSLRWDHALDRHPFRLGGNTFSTACADVDDDGDLDLVNFEIVH